MSNFPEKVEKIRENLTRWQKGHGNEFDYVLTEFSSENELTGEVTTYINEREHLNILKYLESKGYIKINEELTGSINTIKILPKKKPTVRLKTLELISRELKDYYSGTEIVSFLKEAGADERFIIYPQSKWYIFYCVFEELAISKDKKDEDLLLKIIAEAIHPLNLDGNPIASEALKEKFGYWLRFDGFEIWYLEKENIFKISGVLTDEEEREIWEESDKQELSKWKVHLKFLCQPINKDKISLLRKSFQSFMNVVEVFCDNPSNPTTKLNIFYLSLKKSIWNSLEELNLKKFSRFAKLNWHSSPFTNLFSAEKEYQNQKKELSWQKIRPDMNDVYGLIEELYQEVSGSDVLSEPDRQKELNTINLYISELKEKVIFNEKKDNESEQENIGSTEIFEPEIIKRLELVKPDDVETGKYQIVINSRYDQAKLLRHSSRMDALMNAIDYMEHYQNSIPYNKDIADYFNYNEHSPLYFNGRYKLTTILIRNPQGAFEVAGEIETKVITTRQLKNRLEKYLLTIKSDKEKQRTTA